ncbi:MAG: hypothetical protein AB4041_20935 [Microcystaceae cyanobacterium]
MHKIDPYLNYWKTKQQETQSYHQTLAQKARESLVPIVDYLTQHFNIKKIILFGSLVKENFCETSNISDIDLAKELNIWLIIIIKIVNYLNKILMNFCFGYKRSLITFNGSLLCIIDQWF